MRRFYLDVLVEAWEQHLAPREVNAPTVISTFAGCGGSSLGYSMAGFRELLAVEWNDNAAATFRMNFPDVPLYHGDIRSMSIEECLRLSGAKPGELDVLDGSPPCQGFSIAGKREMDDERNQLFREYVRLLQGLRPRVLVMENVAGMVAGRMKLIFVEILRELRASGYRVSARLLNAKYFNVPQSRERMIFVGVREDLGREPSHPSAEAHPYTVRDAWSGLGSGEVLMITAGNERHTLAGRLPASGMDRPSPTLVRSGNTCVQLRQQDAPALSPLYRRYWQQAGQGSTVGKFNSIKRLALDRVAGTLHTMPGAPFHPIEPRAISTEERKRLGSFPESFRFPSRQSATECIGNSVPPLFMRAIASHIREHVLSG